MPRRNTGSARIPHHAVHHTPARSNYTFRLVRRVQLDGPTNKFIDAAWQAITAQTPSSQRFNLISKHRLAIPIISHEVLRAYIQQSLAIEVLGSRTLEAKLLNHRTASARHTEKAHTVGMLDPTPDDRGISTLGFRLASEKMRAEQTHYIERLNRLGHVALSPVLDLELPLATFLDEPPSSELLETIDSMAPADWVGGHLSSQRNTSGATTSPSW